MPLSEVDVEGAPLDKLPSKKVTYDEGSSLKDLQPMESEGYQSITKHTSIMEQFRGNIDSHHPHRLSSAITSFPANYIYESDTGGSQHSIYFSPLRHSRGHASDFSPSSSFVGVGSKSWSSRNVIIIMAMCVLYMASSLTMSSFGILVDLIVERYSVSYHGLGFMSSMVSLGYAVVQPISGLVVLVFGPWKSVAISCALSITGNIFFGIMRRIIPASIFRLWTGLGCGMVYGIVWWFIKSEIPPDKFGKVSATLEISNAIGTVLGSIPLYYFSQVVDWTYLFTIVLPVVVLIGGVIAAVLLQPFSSVILVPKSIHDQKVNSLRAIEEEEGENEDDETAKDGNDSIDDDHPYTLEKPDRDRNGGSQLDSHIGEFSAIPSVLYHTALRSATVSWKRISIDILCSRNEWGAYLILIAVMGSMDTLGFTWLVSILKEKYDFSDGEAGICLMVSNFMVIPVIFGVGALSDYLRIRLPFVAIGIALAILHVVLLRFAFFSFYPAIFVCALNGISQGFSEIIYVLAAESLTADHTEQAVAWGQLFYMGGVTLITALMGIVIEHSSMDGGMSFMLALLCCSVLAFPLFKETHGTFLKGQEMKR